MKVWDEAMVVTAESQQARYGFKKRNGYYSDQRKNKE